MIQSENIKIRVIENLNPGLCSICFISVVPGSNKLSLLAEYFKKLFHELLKTEQEIIRLSNIQTIIQNDLDSVFVTAVFDLTKLEYVLDLYKRFFRSTFSKAPVDANYYSATNISNEFNKDKLNFENKNAVVITLPDLNFDNNLRQFVESKLRIKMKDCLKNEKNISLYKKQNNVSPNDESVLITGPALTKEGYFSIDFIHNLLIHRNGLINRTMKNRDSCKAELMTGTYHSHVRITGFANKKEMLKLKNKLIITLSKFRGFTSSALFRRSYLLTLLTQSKNIESVCQLSISTARLVIIGGGYKYWKIPKEEKLEGQFIKYLKENIIQVV